jgi:hypothetical protein
MEACHFPLVLPCPRERILIEFILLEMAKRAARPGPARAR